MTKYVWAWCTETVLISVVVGLIVIGVVVFGSICSIKSFVHFFSNANTDTLPLINLANILSLVSSSSSRPSQLSSSLRRQVWSAVKRLDTISPKLLIMFDPHFDPRIFVYPTQLNPMPFSISDDATTNWATLPTLKSSAYISASCWGSMRFICIQAESSAQRLTRGPQMTPGRLSKASWSH